MADQDSARLCAASRPGIGAIAGFGALQSETGSNEFGTEWSLVGAEAQAYTDNLTFYAQGGLALPIPQDVNTNGAFWQTYGNFAFVRGVLRYFPTDNIRLQAEATYARGTINYFAFNTAPSTRPFTTRSCATARRTASRAVFPTRTTMIVPSTTEEITDESVTASTGGESTTIIS